MCFMNNIGRLIYVRYNKFMLVFVTHGLMATQVENLEFKLKLTP